MVGKSIVVAYALCASVAFAGQSDSVALVSGGVAKCRVSVAADADLALKFGARELQKYMSLATGCGALDGAYPIVVEVKSVAENGGELAEDGFAIDVRRDGMSITGANPRGALYGCYEILKRYAGMRWLVPGDDGEYCVHEGRDIAVPLGRIVQNPYLRIRETRANTEEGFLWHARNNMLSEMNTARFVNNGRRTKECDRLEELCVRGIGISGHIQSDLLIGPYSGKEREARRDAIYAEHPEWFPLIKGRRIKIIGPRDANPCVSNPALLDHLASNLCERIKGPHGCESYVTIGNNDTTIWCECDKCRALDAPERVGTPGAMSDRYWHLVGGIAKRVWKRIPEARMGGWAYQNYWYPPVRTPIDPRLKVFVSYNNMCWRHSVADPKCKVNEEWRRIYRMWSEKKLPFVVDREPVGGVGCIADTYQPAEHVLYENFKAFRRFGCGGAHFVLMGAQPDFFKWDNRPPWHGKNLGWYAMWQSCYMSAKCMWSLDFDFDATLEEANRLYYGKAWEGGLKAFREYLSDCYYSVDFCSGWGQGAPLGPVMDRPGSKERLLELLGKAVTAAEASGDGRVLKHVLRDKEIFEKSWLYFREQYEKNYKVLDAKAKTGPIVVDGVLDEADWKAANELSGFAPPDWSEVPADKILQTKARVVYEPDGLYFAVEAMEDDIAGLVEDKDHIEIFYSFPDMAERCYQLIVYPDGRHMTWIRNSASNVDKTFSGEVKVAVKKGADRWTAEVAVPADAIGSKCLPGQVWKANVCRMRVTKGRPREPSSACNGVFYGPGNFVNVKFMK